MQCAAAFSGCQRVVLFVRLKKCEQCNPCDPDSYTFPQHSHFQPDRCRTQRLNHLSSAPIFMRKMGGGQGHPTPPRLEGGPTSPQRGQGHELNVADSRNLSHQLKFHGIAYAVEPFLAFGNCLFHVRLNFCAFLVIDTVVAQRL